MNKRDAKTVALLVMASCAVTSRNPVEGDGIPHDDQMRIGEAEREWGWDTLGRFGQNAPFTTAEDAYVWVRDYWSKR
jgi:hypothetical protein